MKFKNLGPGLIWAGAAIGVSHLVQSTRAGASYGFDLIWVIIIANILKYPFFEFAPRYTIAAGESLIDGYKRMGKGTVVLYAAITLLTMFPIQAAITLVTSGIIMQVFGLSISIFWVASGLLILSALILVIGKYSLLDKTIKIIIILLTVSTIIAVLFSVTGNLNTNSKPFFGAFKWQTTDIIFLIAFIGWMPSAIDISVWHSMWIKAKIKDTGYTPKLKESLFDFNVGYIGTIFLSACFLVLGACVMYVSNEQFSSKSGEFAGQLIALYTSCIGDWAYYVIAIAALATMFSTTITCIDAYPRVLTPTFKHLIPNNKSLSTKKIELFWLVFLIIGTGIALFFFASDLKQMVDFATILSFLVAPVLGYLNFKAVTGKHIPKNMQPKLWLKILTWSGLLFLTIFGIYFIYMRFF